MIKIRKAYCEDGHNVSQLLKSKYSFKSTDAAKQAFEEECSSHHYRIAFEGEKILGLISWRTQGTIEHGVAELTRITVSEEVPDTALVKEMLFDVMVAEADYYYKQQGSKLRKVFSMIHADNRQIKEFFQNKGMTQEAILKNHFRKNQDELVFSLFFN